MNEGNEGVGFPFANQDDLDRLAHDPAFRMAVWDRPGKQILEERLASQPTQSRLVNPLADNSVQDFWKVLAAGISRWKLPDHFRPTRHPQRRNWRPMREGLTQRREGAKENENA